MFINLLDLKEPTHYSQRTGVVVCPLQYNMVGSQGNCSEILATPSYSKIQGYEDDDDGLFASPSHGGNKCLPGSPNAASLHITHSIMMVIHQCLDTNSFNNHCMFWAACNLGYICFLHSVKFTVPTLANFSLTVW